MTPPGTPTTVTVLTQKSYGPGSSVIPETAVPDNVLAFDLVVDISQLLDPAITLALAFEFSFDGGVTWPSGANTVVVGRPTNTGSTVVGRNLGDPVPNRKVRGSVTITGGGFVTSAQLTTYA